MTPREVFGSLRRRVLLANGVGATIAFVYLTVVSPPRPAPAGDEWEQLLLAPVYVALAAIVGNRVARPRVRMVADWLAARRPPSATERALVLALPRQAALLAGAGWLVASLVFGIVTATHHPAAYVAGVVLGIQLAGLTSAAATYLLAERSLRPVFALVFAGEPHSGPAGEPVVGTRPRLLVSWALGSGVALVAIAVGFLGRGGDSGDEILPSVLFLVVTGLFAGGVLIAVAARSIADPVERLRAAVERVEAGSLEEEVVVDDGGEIGSLQSGFNRMVAGLRERERIRETLGTYVDRDVAAHILREGTALEGEEVEVTLMFVDIRDFTSFAETASAREVVATVNRLFERVVPIVHAHKGHVDKFVGDGLLAVFGAPRRRDDHAGQALAAAIEVEKAAREELGGELAIGIGLSSGTVVAGNVGGAGRLEFSVIGDAVNVAARVEAATRETGDTILLAERTRELLGDVPVPLVERPGIELKGKRERVSLYAPARRVAT